MIILVWRTKKTYFFHLCTAPPASTTISASGGIVDACLAKGSKRSCLCLCSKCLDLEHSKLCFCAWKGVATHRGWFSKTGLQWELGSKTYWHLLLILTGVWEDLYNFIPKLIDHIAPFFEFFRLVWQHFLVHFIIQPL